jgi:hypothetical protein
MCPIHAFTLECIQGRCEKKLLQIALIKPMMEEEDEQKPP